MELGYEKSESSDRLWHWIGGGVSPIRPRKWFWTLWRLEIKGWAAAVQIWQQYTFYFFFSNMTLVKIKPGRSCQSSRMNQSFFPVSISINCIYEFQMRSALELRSNRCLKQRTSLRELLFVPTNFRGIVEMWSEKIFINVCDPRFFKFCITTPTTHLFTVFCWFLRNLFMTDLKVCDLFLWINF